MKCLIVMMVLMLGMAEYVFSDAGNCVKYHVDIQLKNGSRVKGSIYVGTYDPKFDFSDGSFMDYARQGGRDTLHVYRNIQQLKFPETGEWGNREGCRFLFDAVAPKDQVRVFYKDIESIKPTGYTVCSNCDDKKGYAWQGINVIITELTQAEITLLRTRPVAFVAVGPGDEYVTRSYWLMSYSSDYNQAKLKLLADKFIRETGKLKDADRWSDTSAGYLSFKRALRKNKVIVFATESAY